MKKTTQKTPYVSIETLLTTPVEKPELLDRITFEYRGVTVHAIGTLHGLTGGTNKEYIELVNKTIAASPGTKFCEKKMKTLYQGLEIDMEDWRIMRLRDAFRLSFSAVSTPLRLVKLLWATAAEALSRKDPFGQNGLYRLQDIGGSGAFHRLHPSIRRNLAGFPSPREYLAANLSRRRGKNTLKAPVFPDTSWYWLSLIEPYADIPCRSIHMLEFATTYAQLAGLKEITLLVGEVHNSDMAWYARKFANVDFDNLTSASSRLADSADIPLAEVAPLVHRAREWAKLRFAGKWHPASMAYSLALSLGMALPIGAQWVIALYLLKAFGH